MYTCGECMHRVHGVCKCSHSVEYNQKVTENHTCEDGISKIAYDYRTMTPWQFVHKYYC